MRTSAVSFLVLLSLCVASPTRADFALDLARIASDEFFTVYLIAGVARPQVNGSLGDSETQTLRALDSLVTSTAATVGLKELFSRPRLRPLPGDSDDSFPSGHAAASFAIAAIQSEFHPDEAPYWYAGATLISASRLKLKRHRVGDVLAGAGLGYLIAQLELDSEHGLLIAPFVEPQGDGFGIELRFRP